MNKQMFAVMQKRSELVAKIAAQRGQLAGLSSRWKTPLAMADQGLAAVNFLRSRPALLAGVVALLVIRRRGVLGLVKFGWRAWKGYRYFSAFSQKISPRN